MLFVHIYLSPFDFHNLSDVLFAWSCLPENTAQGTRLARDQAFRSGAFLQTASTLSLADEVVQLHTRGADAS